MTTVPTILIGLGGIGSRVADQVFARIPPEQRDRVLVHGFDTNVNDISKLGHLGSDRVTQTSRDWSVRQYLNGAENSVREWFPDDTPELLRKPLTDGAGQIRVVSRLAYRAALDAHALGRLEQQIKSLFFAHGEKLTTAVRVLIVSSLVGGTGSGIFLQVAMFLRELLDRQHRKPAILVRGAFLLPDVFIGTNLLDSQEWPNVRANAYAALKELDAIAMAARGKEGGTGPTIELEFRPGQTDAQGRRDFAIPNLMVPYDFSFLFDFENSAGQNIAHFDNYLEQVVQSTYLLLFSPISANLFSEEDNKFLELIRDEGRNRYGGAGVATLTYPYEAILSYLALRWSTETLSEQWLTIDQDYDKELRDYEEEIRNGARREKPVLAQRYVWLLDNRAAGEKPDPKFVSIHRSAHEKGDHGQTGAPIAESFLAAVDAEIRRVAESDAGLAEQAAKCRVDEGLIAIRERAASEIGRVEDELAAMRERVMKFIAETKTYLHNRVVAQDCTAPGCLEEEDCRLNTWLLAKREPMHPVAVRYTLYRIQLELKSRISQIGPGNQNMLKALEAYARTYDLTDTKDIDEDAGDRIRAALKQPFWARALNNHFKDFVEEYVDKSGSQLKRLMSIVHLRLRELVYSELLKSVDIMIADWERYFQNLRDVRNRLLDEANRLEVEHEQAGDPTRLFVLATGQDKKTAWDDLRPRLAGENLPTQISRQIYLGQYRRFCQRRDARGMQENEDPETTQAMFRKDVVGWCVGELRKVDACNLHIFEALRREALQRAKPVDDWINDRVGEVSRLARPFVPNVQGASWLESWGVHEDAHDALSGEARQRLLGSDRVRDKAFSRYQLVRYSSTYGLKAEDLPKFSAGDAEGAERPGAYYEAYRDRIRELNHGGKTVTPHLDRRWHLPAYMPDLNSRQWEIERDKINRAFVLGLIHDWLIAKADDGPLVWLFKQPATGELIAVSSGGKPTPGKTHLLYAALALNPAIVDHVAQGVAKQFTTDREQFPDELPKHACWRGAIANNALEVILAMPKGDPADASLRDAAVNQLLPTLLWEIRSYAQQALGSHRETSAKKAAAELIVAMRDTSKTYLEADRNSRDFAGWDAKISQALRELGAA